MPGIVGVLLAAGASSRFGSNKLMHRLPDGTPMAVTTAINLRPSCDRMVAVLRPDHDELATLLTEVGCELVFCPEAEGGMGHSLASGVRATAEAAGWIVALADMPFIADSSYQKLADCLRSGASLVTTEYMGRRAHPVGFSQKWFSQLTALKGDEGGKSILKNYQQDLILCPVDDAGVILDVDYPTDLICAP
ncbi:nucleotidyltransferase family protein [Noviherbaspirillum sedimenti]|uniref:Nucleotidyltransferase family protein n=1 Tax=Noviherbaspirillum sedimenti TaxID=2320865 RepID=A0A3A3GGB2_9BURK|nr:nucleotidyltransferase family protein [Noviherbaspirillum sedimenti]RJG01306.1 nucleotidyltransferase family protein [Noviherbaspirillum sedimenti]